MRLLRDTDTPAPGRTRRNRGSEVVREALINAAIEQFGALGFDGTSTRSIADAAGAHQSQIAYHFDSKEELWRRCLDLLMDELDDSIRDAAADVGDDPVDQFAAVVRGLVAFAARRPELNRIMMHEATSSSDRLAWLVDSQVGPRHRALVDAWKRLVASGRVQPIDADVVYHTLIGAASLLYANAPEAVLLGIDPTSADLVERHADALVTMFLRPAESERHVGAVHEQRTGPPGS